METYIEETEKNLFKENMNILKNSSSNSYLKNLFYPNEATTIYQKDKLFLGQNIETKKPFYIDIRRPTRCTFISMSGGGKTWLLRGMADRSLKKYSCVFISDVKGEMVSSNKELQSKFGKLLGDGEYPTKMDIISLVPRFISRYSGLPKENINYQLSLKDLELADMITLFGCDGETAHNRATEIASIYTLIESGQIKSLEDLKVWVRKSKLNEVTKKWLNKEIFTLQNYEVIGDREEFRIDLLKELNEGKNIAFNLRGYEDVNLNWTRTYVAVILRKLYRFKRDGKMKKGLWIVMDEAHDFIPKLGRPSSKIEMLRIIDKGRLLGISISIACQDIKRIDENALKQSRFIFLNSTITEDNFKDILKQCQIWTDRYNDPAYYAESFASLRRFQWGVVDRERKKIFWIKPPSPLSRHMEAQDYEKYYNG